MQSIQEIRSQQFTNFTSWVDQHITGDEKGEAHLFLDRLFQAFGHNGLREAGATLEMRVKNDAGGTAFADLVWKPIVLVEMKKRGTDLRRHYRQAFDYWTRLVPRRPRYVVLCNFDEFWVYDFEAQMDTPVDQLRLTDLPERYGPLAFLFPLFEKPTFGNDQQAVTREAANLLALCFNRIVQRGVLRQTAQKFILQMLVVLFSEDIGLLKRYMVSQLLDECREPRDSYDLLGGLFVEMNTPGTTSGGRFKGVDYFNGGLFAQPARLELESDEIHYLKEASRADWSQVRPEIFGALFEHSLDQKERHAFGAHFTSPTDIMKIVGPTIVEPWREQIEGAKTLKRLDELKNRMLGYTILDPACGSGNFLYIAYRELKRLEFRLNERITTLSAKQTTGQTALGLVTASQFFGIDINPFAVELAKVTMVIARKLAIDELHVNEHPLPLDNLDENFWAADALIGSNGMPFPWPKADVVIGNPPFLSAKKFKPERGPDYVQGVWKAYPEVPGMADYCVYWFRKAHDHLQSCTSEDPFTGRAGLVGTQNIRNNQSRVGGLDYIVSTGSIVEAVDSQPWSGEANVHVSIVNWAKTKDVKVLPPKRRLWFKIADTSTKKKEGKRASSSSKEYDLSYRECTHINSALSDQVDVSGAKRLQCNTFPQRVFQGQVPGHEAFVLNKDEAIRFIKGDSHNREVIHPFLIGRDVVTGNGRPTRWVIDFQSKSVTEASSYKLPFDRIKAVVLPERQQKAQDGKSKAGGLRPHHQLFLRHWWRQSYGRPEMISLISSLPRYIVCSGVTKRPIFNFIDSGIRPDHAVFVFAFADDYSFGILQSHTHWLWFMTKCSKLTERFRYTPPSVYDTFPWPQQPTATQIEDVAKAGRKIRDIRRQVLQDVKGGLRAAYRILELPGTHPLKDAHAALDLAVLKAYGFSHGDDLLTQLLNLNLDLAARIERKNSVTSPGIPANFPTPSQLITDDCIRPEPLTL